MSASGPTPRATRLIRAPHLAAFREALMTLALDGSALDARDRLIVVPTHAAGAHLVRTLEDRALREGGVLVLPELITPDELVIRLSERLPQQRPLLTQAEREVLLGAACRSVRDQGIEPPFRVRPGLVAETLAFYDALRRRQKDVETFERLALGILEPGAVYDRGAERLVRQTRFLVAAFRLFEQRCRECGDDEHTLRERLMREPSAQPWTHVVLTVTDQSSDPHGLLPAEWDLLTRVPGLARLDVLVTDTVIAGALHERMHDVLPGLEEVRLERGEHDPAPMLMIPAGGSLVHVARDREEEVAGFARAVKRAARRGEVSLDRVALVVHQPLPYVYVARDVLRSAAIPCQMFDALPLAAEPYSAALDLVFSAVSSGFARSPAIALLQSPHFQFRSGDTATFSARDVVALDRALTEAGYLGEIQALDRLLTAWRAADPSHGHTRRALRAGEALLTIARELAPLRSAAPTAEHVTRLLAFLTRVEQLPGPDDPLRVRQLRARAAVLATLAMLRDAHARFDPSPVEFEEVATLVRRWIDGQTFAPRAGESGVHLVDAASARFGDFDHVQLAGLVDGEWPDRPRRNIFYSPAVLRALGWSGDSERLGAARAAFVDLLQLARMQVTVSTFTLEADAIVAPSTLLDELDRIAPEAVEQPPVRQRIFDYEALGLEPVDTTLLTGSALDRATRRLAARERDGNQREALRPEERRAFSLSALERYQDCPFKFFAADVLRVDEMPDDGSVVSPRARGRLVHELFQRFFERWDRDGGGTIGPDRQDEARALFQEIAEPLLARLPEAEAAIERARLFGSAIALGMVDVVLGLEASRPGDVRERWLEYRLEGDFALGMAGGRRVSLRGVADRIDLLAGNRLRVIDYKSGQAPNTRRALQVPVYALCARERLEERDGQAWAIDEAAYVSLAGKRAVAHVVRGGAADSADVLDAARARVLEVLEGIESGDFPVRPHEPMMCRYCAYPSVCRKDYIEDA